MCRKWNNKEGGVIKHRAGLRRHLLAYKYTVVLQTPAGDMQASGCGGANRNRRAMLTQKGDMQALVAQTERNARHCGAGKYVVNLEC